MVNYFCLFDTNSWKNTGYVLKCMVIKTHLTNSEHELVATTIKNGSSLYENVQIFIYTILLYLKTAKSCRLYTKVKFKGQYIRKFCFSPVRSNS